MVSYTGRLPEGPAQEMLIGLHHSVLAQTPNLEPVHTDLKSETKMLSSHDHVKE